VAYLVTHYTSMLDVGIPFLVQNINRGSIGPMRSGRVRTRQDSSIIHNIINNREDDCNFPEDKKSAEVVYETAEEEFTEIPGATTWTSCMPMDTSSFKFVEQFEWPSSFSMIPQQRQKPKRNQVGLRLLLYV
jgi:hypothetical protein